MGYQLLNILVFAVVGVAFVSVTIAVVGRLVRPRMRPSDEPSKEETYECGEPAMGPSWVRFDIRFYAMALIFLIFDVEVAFLYPWAVVYRSVREAGMGLFAVLEIVVFLLVLGVGFVYCWVKGDLDWIKGVQRADWSVGSESTRRRPATPTGTSQAVVSQAEAPDRTG